MGVSHQARHFCLKAPPAGLDSADNSLRVVGAFLGAKRIQPRHHTWLLHGPAKFNTVSTHLAVNTDALLMLRAACYGREKVRMCQHQAVVRRR